MMSLPETPFGAKMSAKSGCLHGVLICHENHPAMMFYNLKVMHIEPRQLSNIQIVESCNSPLFEYWRVVFG